MGARCVVWVVKKGFEPSHALFWLEPLTAAWQGLHMSPAGASVARSASGRDPALVGKYPFHKGCGEVDKVVIRSSGETIVVFAGSGRFAGRAGKKAFAVADENNAVSHGWIPSRTKAVQFDAAIAPWFAIAAAAFSESGVFLQSFKPRSHKEVPCRMAGITAPESHELADALAEIAHEASPPGGGLGGAFGNHEGDFFKKRGRPPIAPWPLPISPNSFSIRQFVCRGSR